MSDSLRERVGIPTRSSIEGRVKTVIVSAIVSMAFAVYGALDELTDGLLEATATVLDVLDLSIGIVAELPLDVVAIVADVAASLAAAAGPFAPIVVAFAIAAMLVVIRETIDLTVRVIPFL